MPVNPRLTNSFLPTFRVPARQSSASAAVLTAALGVLNTQQLMAQSDPAIATEVQSLKDQVEQLQGQINKLEAKQPPTGAPAAETSKPAPRVAQNKSNRFSIESSDGQYSIGVTGRINIDVGGYPSFKPDNRSVGTRTLSSGLNARRARIGVNGKAGGVWTYQFIYDGGNSQDTTAAGIQWAQVAYVGFQGIQIDLPGYSEVPFTIEYATSSNDVLFMERAAPVNVAAGLGTGDFRANAGVSFYSDRYWIGVYLTGPQSGDSHTQVQQRFGAFQRITGQLLSGSDHSLHLGFGIFELFKAPNAAPDQPYTVSLSDRPELRIDPTQLLSSGAIGSIANPVTGATVLNPELAGSWKSWFLQGEYFHYNIQRRGLKNNKFDGAYAELSWVLTGEHRSYVPPRAAYSGISPAHPVSAGGGTGAWELAVRYSYVDLVDQFTVGAPSSSQPNAINGGRLNNVTVGINWYVNSYLRLMVNYVHSRLDKANGTAAPRAPLGVPVGYKLDGVALRTQIAW